MKKAELNEEEICRRYIETNDGAAKIAKEMHTNKDRVKEILQKNGIELKKRGKQPLRDVFVVPDWKIEKYPEKDGVEYVAVDRETGEECNDVYNRGGHLTTHIEQKYGVPTPTLYDRHLYYMRTGNYWWEQWFDIVERPKKTTKKCKYCDWETEDVDNRSGAYEVHLKKVHGISKFDYIKEFPEEKPYFALVCETLNRQLSDNIDDYVVCKICGKKYSSITSHHLDTHGITKLEYQKRYGCEDLISKTTLEKCQAASKLGNMNTTFIKSSAPESDIADFIRSLGFEVVLGNRKILEGKEIDIYLPEVKIGFEYDGLIYHSEDYGKPKTYHLQKTEKAKEKGVTLYHIFEDEYKWQKDKLFTKIKHVLGKDDGIKINARECEVRDITHSEAKDFLNAHHLLNFGTNDSVSLGAFHENVLVAVMTFWKEKPKKWKLTRFATHGDYLCRGIGGKLFKYFITNYQYFRVETFADRRWTPFDGSTFYNSIGFEFVKYETPNYWLFCKKFRDMKRHHRLEFKKNALMEMCGYPDTMTTDEMLYN